VKQFYSKSKDQADLRDALGPLNWRRALSNFHASPLTVGGLAYPTPEHAFHAAKYGHCDKPGLAARFEVGGGGGGGGGRAVGRDPAAAKLAGGRGGMAKLGATLDARSWGAAREGAMRTICEARWEQHAPFREALRAVAARGWRLLHFERAGAKSFWGGAVSRATGQVEGANALGEMLMALAAARDGAEVVATRPLKAARTEAARTAGSSRR